MLLFTVYSIWFSAQPGPPVNLRSTRIALDFADLEWNPPLSDGGSAITKYVVQKSQKKEEWVKVTSVSSYQTYCRASNLEEDMEYYFSVYAVNDVGESVPCVMSTPITTQKGIGKLIRYQQQ